MRYHQLPLSALFTLTLFVSAGLLFIVELMIGKMILPLLGGTPAVWNTCMMFFQALLLGGYIYAHFASTVLGMRVQIAVHGAVLMAALMVLPIAISRQWVSTVQTHPVVVVLTLLSLSVGPPFFVLSASAPLMQHWFSRTGHPEAADPYFLYSASNLGSVAALLSYPVLIEPGLTLRQQSLAWTVGYCFLVVLTLGSAVLAWRLSREACSASSMSPSDERRSCPVDAESSRLSFSVRTRWVALSFVPSSLLLRLTTFLTTDVASIPLLWVIPLALYLLSFVLVFSRLPSAVHKAFKRLFPIAVIALVAVNGLQAKPSISVLFMVNLAVFFVVAMVCHGELARNRPSVNRLTEYYLLISVGGLLGGVFNSLLAPVLFKTVAEYPLVLALSALLLPPRRGSVTLSQRFRLPVAVVYGTPLILCPLTFWLIVYQPLFGIDLLWLSGVSGFQPENLKSLLTFSIPALLCYGLSFATRPCLFGIGIGAVTVAVLLASTWKEDIVYRDRSFFGVVKVRDDMDRGYRYLVHGKTQHGKQSLYPSHKREAVSYYHPAGPVGQVFGIFSGPGRKERVALVGLGAGTLASYGASGQHFTFYEIDPLMRRVATDPSLFSYLQESGAQWDIVLGDARLTLESAPDHHYGLMVIDAFSSDAIPVHLLTREALILYFLKLEDTGVLVMHISNRHLDLEPVVAGLARDAGLAMRARDDIEETNEKTPSHWVILARKAAHLGRLERDGQWSKPPMEPSGPVWTDDYSDLLNVMRWRKH